jgi:hypothetical protein
LITGLVRAAGVACPTHPSLRRSTRQGTSNTMWYVICNPRQISSFQTIMGCCDDQRCGDLKLIRRFLVKGLDEELRPLGVFIFVKSRKVLFNPVLRDVIGRHEMSRTHIAPVLLALYTG